MRASATVLLLCGLAGALSGCSSDSPADPARTVAVSSTADACTLSPTSAPAGELVFAVTNDGPKTTEFYLLDGSGNILGEVEDIGPGLTRELRVSVEAGDYVGSCKPGMTGDGIRTQFTATSGG